MKVSYTTLDGRTTLAFDAQGIKSVFAGLAQVQEVFEHNQCGQCESGETVLNLREHDGHQYYSKSCTACGAQLDFGQHREGGTLFTKRRDKDGNEIGKNGWYHYQRRERSSSGEESQETPESGGDIPF